MPIFIADYVLLGYGTGAVMGVPAHDQRDFAFCQLSASNQAGDRGATKQRRQEQLEDAFTRQRLWLIQVRSRACRTRKGKRRCAAIRPGAGIGRPAVTYRLRDWLISPPALLGNADTDHLLRDCGIVPVPEADLPVLLPEDAEFLPTGESPLKLSRRLSQHHLSFMRRAC